jgi:bifunctional NMN adenylyltransferase/nudix hydrolase
VVIQSGHVLLVKRRSYPGKGLWALPGGFLEPDETIEQACLRELAEETALKVPDAVLKGHIKAREVFDAPYRSSRGRTVTHAHLIHLDPGPLPKIKTGGLAGDDETYKIDWVPLAKLRRELFFEDHYPIIIRMAGLI